MWSQHTEHENWSNFSKLTEMRKHWCLFRFVTLTRQQTVELTSDEWWVMSRVCKNCYLNVWNDPTSKGKKISSFPSIIVRFHEQARSTQAKHSELPQNGENALHSNHNSTIQSTWQFLQALHVDWVYSAALNPEQCIRVCCFNDTREPKPLERDKWAKSWIFYDRVVYKESVSSHRFVGVVVCGGYNTDKCQLCLDIFEYTQCTNFILFVFRQFQLGWTCVSLHTGTHKAKSAAYPKTWKA